MRRALEEGSRPALRSRALWLCSLAFALLVHSTLPDYDQREWVGQRAWLQVSALGLLLSSLWALSTPAELRPFSPWALLHTRLLRWAPVMCLGALVLHKLWTLLALRDVLTQSALLLLFCLIGLVVCLFEPAEETSVLALSRARDVTALTYVGAALHKLNTTFLTSAQSCALHGVEVSARLVGLPWPEPPHMGVYWLDTLSAQLYALGGSPLWVGGAVICIELALAYALWSGARWLWLLGLAFHLPLTLTIAPAFAAVMFCGYVASTLVHTRPPALSAPRAALWLSVALWVTFGAHGDALKAITLCVITAWGCRAPHSLSATQAVRRRARWPERGPRRLLMGLTLCYGLHLLSPYLGVEVQHSGAMLSNLRVDPPCFNSLIAPKLGWDPYIRIDEAQLGRAERPEQVKILSEQLWGWAALNTLRRNWCSPVTAPFRVKGSWGGERFDIQDLCAPGSLLGLQEQHPLKTALPIGWQRLQKNLSRRCDQACVH